MLTCGRRQRNCCACTARIWRWVTAMHQDLEKEACLSPLMSEQHRDCQHEQNRASKRAERSTLTPR